MVSLWIVRSRAVQTTRRLDGCPSANQGEAYGKARKALRAIGPSGVFSIGINQVPTTRWPLLTTNHQGSPRKRATYGSSQILRLALGPREEGPSRPTVSAMAIDSQQKIAGWPTETRQP